jgi:tRNA (cytosine38-C5)-methyltransferase
MNRGRVSALDWGGTSPGREIQVIQCFDVSELANKVYEFNFKKKPSVRSIEHLDSTYLDSLGADTWLMSPPCKVHAIILNNCDDSAVNTWDQT